MSRPSVHPDWGALVRRIGVPPKPRLERRSVLRSRACVPAPYVDAADCRQSVLGACSSSISSSISSSNNVSIRTVLHTRSTAPFVGGEMAYGGEMALRKMAHTNDHRWSVVSMQSVLSRLAGPHCRRLPPPAFYYRRFVHY